MRKYLLLLGLQQALAIAVALAAVFVCWMCSTFITMDLSPPGEFSRFLGVAGYLTSLAVSTILFVEPGYEQDKLREVLFKWLERFSKSSEEPSQG
jgi:hypothetical protein